MPALDDALVANREAAKRFLATAHAVAREKWAAPVAPGKWSPAQITEHVALSTEVALKAIKGDPSMGSIPSFLRWLPRKLGFDPTIKKGRFPEKQRGPAIFKPSDAHTSYDISAARFERAIADLESHARELARAGTHAFEHSFFGRVAIADYVKFNALHSEHHERQLR